MGLVQGIMGLPTEELDLSPDVLRRLGIDADVPFAVPNRQVCERTQG